MQNFLMGEARDAGVRKSVNNKHSAQICAEICSVDMDYFGDRCWCWSELRQSI